MKCPLCEAHDGLKLVATPEGLRLRQCSSCEGRWIRSDDYWRWRTAQPKGESVPADALPELAEIGEPDVRFCPEDGYLLARFDVGPDHAFWIDQCRNCSGVWLDAGEWEHLVHAGLGSQLHLILSAEWQDELRKSEREVTERQQWRRQLGEADFDRIAEIKAWLDSHPKRSQLYAYLRFHERAV